MEKIVFLAKINNNNNRDCVKYIDIGSLENSLKGKLECEHYFPGVHIEGSCFSSGLDDLKKYEYKDIKTILTEDELKKIYDYEAIIYNLGFGITKEDERYLKGINATKNIEDIINKLQTQENDNLFSEIQKEEIEWLEENEDLSKDDVEYIFNNYNLYYRDRAVISYVYGDIETFGKEKADSLGIVSSNCERYFDFELFGKDLLDDGYYLELDDGRIIELSY